MRSILGALGLLLIHSVLQPAVAQSSSRNIHVAGHLVVEGGLKAVHTDQHEERPFVYALSADGGLIIIGAADLSGLEVMHQTAPIGARALTSFRQDGDTFLAIAGEAITVINVTDPASLAGNAAATTPMPVADLFAYQHSSGSALILAASAEQALIYTTDVAQGPVATIDTPSHPGPQTGFEDVFAGFDPATQQDRLYLAGAGGYYVFDITSLDSPRLLVTIHSAAVQRGRVMAPVADGEHALTLASYRTAPMRVFSLSQERVRTAVGAWTDSWQSELVDAVVRWPYAFVAAMEHGMQVVNIFDPGAPYTDAWFRAEEQIAQDIPPLARAPQGIVDLDVRNHDGLIFAADRDHGLWILELEAFMGWHGHTWGLPNMSDAQDWENGPDGK